MIKFQRILFLIVLLGIFSALSVAKAQSTKDHVGVALEKLFFNPETQKTIAPSETLRKVISVAFWNTVTGQVSKSDTDLVLQNISTDDGLVAQVLFERGFNYQVLEELRHIVHYDPNHVDFGVIDVSSLPEIPSGVPEFTQVDTSQWNTSLTGILRVMYRSDINWVLEQARARVYKAVELAGTTPHSLANLFVNRYLQARELLDFFGFVERTLTQYQALLATLEVRSAKEGPPREKDFEKLKSNVETELGTLMAALRTILETKTNSSKPWASLSKAIKNHKSEIAVFEKNLETVTSLTINSIDQIAGDTHGTEKYAKDEIPELVLKLKEQIELFKKMKASWSEIGTYSYFDRDHKWVSIDLHSEENGPYYETGRMTKSRTIPGLEMAPIIQEGELAQYLSTMSKELTEARLQAVQIQSIRAQLEKFQKEHNDYVAGGPIRPREMHPNQVSGFEDRFSKRNKLLSDWIDALIDSSFRHEAYEHKGYVGLQLETTLSPEHQAIMEKLERTSRNFQMARRIGYGVAATAATGAGLCIYLFGSH